MSKAKRDLTHAIICFFYSQIKIVSQFNANSNLISDLSSLKFYLSSQISMIFFYIVDRKYEFTEIHDIKRNINDYVNA